MPGGLFHCIFAFEVSQLQVAMKLEWNEGVGWFFLDLG